MPRYRYPDDQEFIDLMGDFETVLYSPNDWCDDPLIVAGLRTTCIQQAYILEETFNQNGLTIPPWDRLPPLIRNRFIGLTACSPIYDEQVKKYAITVNILDQQKITAMQEYGNLKIWVQQYWLNRIRRYLKGYFLTIEDHSPPPRRGQRSGNTSSLPQRFDIHGILILKNDPNVEIRLQNTIQRITPSFHDEEIQRENYPLRRRGRPAYAIGLRSKGWVDYVLKRPDLWETHSAVAGANPCLASNTLRFHAKALYEFMYQSVRRFDVHG